MSFTEYITFKDSMFYKSTNYYFFGQFYRYQKIFKFLSMVPQYNKSNIIYSAAHNFSSNRILSIQKLLHACIHVKVADQTKMQE